MQKLYTELPWEKASAVQRINSSHSHALKMVQNLSKQEAKSKAMNLIESLPEDAKQIECLDLVLLKNLNDIKANELKEVNFAAYFAHEESEVFFSQFDMAMGQYAFFGHLIVCPELYGCSNEDLKPFMNVWRTIAHYFGIDDSANLVKTEANRTLRLLQDVIDFMVIPGVLHLDHIGLTYGKTLAQALFPIDFHVLVYLAMESFGILLLDLWNEFSMLQKFSYYVVKTFFNVAYGLVYLRKMFNWIFYLLLKQNLSKANQNVRKVATKISRSRQLWRDAFQKITAALRARKHWQDAFRKITSALHARKHWQDAFRKISRARKVLAFWEKRTMDSKED